MSSSAPTLSPALQAALDAVRLASIVTQKVQKQLVTADTLQKKDKSPVTVADFASQAVVAATLQNALPNDPLVGEESAGELREDAQTVIRNAVIEQVQAALLKPVTAHQVLTWIDQAGTATPNPFRFWTLDPIDGTKGFLRGEQYAIALGLIEKGKVTLGALACPNLPMKGLTGHLPSTTDAVGILMFAARGQGTWIAPLSDRDLSRAQRVQATAHAPDQRCFCESVESGHSDQSASVKIASLLNLTAAPVRMDSQAKYATVARGEADVYLRLPTKADYRECIWDHAAGLICVEEAGGTVSDVDGKPLDFSHGRKLEQNRGVIATVAGLHHQVVNAVKATLG